MGEAVVPVGTLLVERMRPSFGKMTEPGGMARGIGWGFVTLSRDGGGRISSPPCATPSFTDRMFN
jgi:hypothetical protein